MQKQAQQLQGKQQIVFQEQKYPQAQLTTLPPTNYIKQYFQTTFTSTPPQVSLPHFFQKVHYLKALFIEPIHNLQAFLLQNYPIGLPISLTQVLCPNHQQVQRKIASVHKASFKYLLKHIQPQLISLYYGDIQNGKKHGYGIYAEFSSETDREDIVYLYEGFFSHDQKQGMAMEWGGRLLFFGHFRGNFHFPQNKAVILYQNGDVYLGGVIRGKRHGKGVYFQVRNRSNQFTKYQSSRNALEYELIVLAFWQDDNLVPKTGSLLRSTLTSIFQTNLLNFQSNWLILNSSLCCGDLKLLQSGQGKSTHFIRDGKGFQYFSNGDIYRGQYKKDKPHGFGCYVWKNGDQYTGQFVEGLREGKGRWIGSNEEIFEGQYMNDQRCGFGIYKWPNGNQYEGEFKNDFRDGYGKMTWRNGEIYTGYWKKGLQHGEGEVRVNLNFTALHKKFLFEKGCRVRKALKSNQQKMLKPVRNVQSQQKFTNKKHLLSKPKQMNSTQHRRKTVGQLQSFRGNSLGSVDRKIDQQFYQKKVSKNEKQVKTQFTTNNNNTIEQQSNGMEVQTKSKKNTLNTQQGPQLLVKSRSVQIDLGSRRKQKEQKNIMKLKQLKSKHSKPEVQLGQTLLRPIKWNNFKYTWQSEK